MALQLTVISLDFESSDAPSVTTFAKDEITIGRSADCDLVLNSQAVSDSHAKLRVELEGDVPQILITDLGSTNGTNLGTRRLEANAEEEIPATERVVIADFLIKPVFIAEEAKKAKSIETQEAQTQTVTQVVNGPSIIEEIPSAIEEASEAESKAKDTKKPELKLASKKEEEKTEKKDKESEASKDLKSKKEEESKKKADKKSEEKIENKEQAKKTEPEKTKDFNASEYAKKDIGAIPTKDVISLSPASLSGKVGDADVQELNFNATQLFTLKGKALHKGAALAGVEIDGGELGRITTDSSGAFCFRNIKEGTKFTLLANRKKFILKSDSASDTLDRDKEITFEATELFNVSGRIVHNGKPLANITIDGGKLGETKTDKDGVYIFKNVPEGTEYTVTPKVEGYLIESAS